MLAVTGASLGTGLVAGAIANTVSTAGAYASVEALIPILEAGYPGVQGLAGMLHFLMLTQLGVTGALIGTAATGLAAGCLAMQPAPHNPGAIRRFLEGPASALRDAGTQVAAAGGFKEAAKAGACAGWTAGKTFGTVGGAISGACTGYSLGMLATGLFTASLPLGIGGALVGAAACGTVLGLGGRYLGGAVGAGFGALAGGAMYGGQQALKP